jgi:hypothetical protein
MLYLDYNWDLSPSGILLDEELNTDQLGWEEGDLFKVEVTKTGRKVLRKVSAVEQFIRGYGSDEGSKTQE